jgi:hypothetical protein
VVAAGDKAAGAATSGEITQVGQGVRVDLKSNDPFKRWVQTSVIRGTANGSVSAIAYAALGDITADQFRALAKIQRDLNADVRLTNRQNVVFRALTEDQLEILYKLLTPLVWRAQVQNLLATLLLAQVPTPATLQSLSHAVWLRPLAKHSKKKGLPRLVAFASIFLVALIAVASTTPATSGSLVPSAAHTVRLRLDTKCCLVDT